MTKYIYSYPPFASLASAPVQGLVFRIGSGFGSVDRPVRGRRRLNQTFLVQNQLVILLGNKIFRPFDFDLMTLKMTSDHGKSYISENYMKNQVEWYPTQLNLIKLIFDLSWPLPTLDDFLCWKIIYFWNLHEKSSWMTLCTTQSDKVDYWPLLTFNPHLWPLEIFIRSLNHWRSIRQSHYT